MKAEISSNVKSALAEDVGAGDLTASLIPADALADAEIICREAAVLCGQQWLDEVFKQLDSGVKVEWYIGDGEAIEAGQRVCRLHGSARSILTGERTALNFLQTLSATATRARLFVDAVAGTDARILDTRKTIPGLRLAQKYAVTCGGGSNHRTGLFDAILIKENHITAAGSIRAAVQQALTKNVEVEIEVESIDELNQALAAGAKRVLLDNFSLAQLKQAVSITSKDARLEASGGVSMDTIRAIAETGVDDISLGTITKDVSAVDFSMLFRRL